MPDSAKERNLHISGRDARDKESFSFIRLIINHFCIIGSNIVILFDVYTMFFNA